MIETPLASLKRADRFAILWGGGLGDILTLRPLLMALEHALDIPPCLFTTAKHLPGVCAELGLRVDLHILPQEPMAALRVFRRFGVRFDWLYLGPYPRIKTRMLAHVVGARRIWSRRYMDVQPFLGEQVLADIKAFGLDDGKSMQPYGGAWVPTMTARKVAHRGDYLLLHPGAKQGWETKQWPAESWIALLRSVLATTGSDVMLVGVPEEKQHLERLVAGSGASGSARVSIETDLSLRDLSLAVEGSRGVVCHNSGILHLAAMLGKTTISLTGASPVYWQPPYAHIRNLTSGLCNLACDQYRCPVPFYRARCIRRLPLETVLEELRERLFPAA